MWPIVFLSFFGQALLFTGLAIIENHLGWAIFLAMFGYAIYMGSMILMFKRNNSIEGKK